MRVTSMFFCALLLSSPVSAQQTVRHTITHEDVFLARRVGSPAISPDGRWVVFSVTEPSYTDGEQVSDLWLVPLDGSAEPRRLTNTKGGEGGVDWSRDSRRIAFSARREGDEASQIYVLDLSSGGEAQRITSISTGAANPLWRPDAKAILFSSMVYPGATTDSANRAAAAERRARKYNARVYDGSPIRLWDRWLDDRKPSLFVQVLEPPPGRRRKACSRVRSSQPGRDSAASWATAATICPRPGHRMAVAWCSLRQPTGATGHTRTWCSPYGWSAPAAVSRSASPKAPITAVPSSAPTARRCTPA